MVPKIVTDTMTSPVEVQEKPKKVVSQVLEAFELLHSNQRNCKIDGGVKLINYLQNKEENVKELPYIVKRLVRSVGANTLQNRAGFYSVLVLLLKKFDFNIQELLEIVGKELHAVGNAKSEVGDVALGQILVCSAIFRSGVINKASDEDKLKIIDTILKAGSKKSYLNSVKYLVLADGLNFIDEEVFSSSIWPRIKAEMKKPLSEHTTDTLYFLLVAKEKFPKTVKLKKLIGVEHVICPDSMESVSAILMTVPDFNGTNHPIYNIISRHIANSPLLDQFWLHIDEALTKHNRNREVVALKLLTGILNDLSTNYEIIPHLISKNFMKLFLDWFKGLQTVSKVRNQNDDEDDNKLMTKKGRELLVLLAKTLKHEKVPSKTRVEALHRLLFEFGDMNFSEVTETSIIRTIIADLDESGVKKLAKCFKKVLLNQSKKQIKEGLDRSWYNNERLKAAEGISYLVLHPSMTSDNDFKLSYMKILLCFGFFKIGGDETVAVSSELSGAIKKCFYRCLYTKLPSVESLVELLRSLIEFIEKNLDNASVKATISKQFPDENMECWTMIKSITEKIEKVENKKKADNVFLILLYELGLFLFSEPKSIEMAKSSIKELASCYDHYKKSEKKKKKSVATEGEIVNDEPEWIEVLIEVLLSILSVDSSVLRSIVQCVFKLLCEYLTPSSIGQIISVLDPQSDANPLMNDSESENDGGDNSDDDSENDENGLSNDENEASDENNASDDDEGSEVENEDIEMEDEKLTVPDQLRIALQKALGDAAPDTDTESIDIDNMTEEEGQKLDAALAEAFSQYNQGKNKKKDRKDKKTLADFRIRVLDLVEIYLGKDPPMDICLGMIAPLIRGLESCIQDGEFKELENRLRKTIKTLAKIKRFSSTDGVTLDLICDYLKSTIDKGNRSHFVYQALGDVITSCGMFLVHCAQKLESSPKKLQPFNLIFVESLESFFKNRNCLLPVIFFHSVMDLDWQGKTALIPVILSNVFNPNIRHFRRNEALELYANFYKSMIRSKTNSTQQIKGFEIDFENKLKEAIENKEFIARDNFFKSLNKVFHSIRIYYKVINDKPAFDVDELSKYIAKNKVVSKEKKAKNVVKDPKAKKIADKERKLKNKAKKKEEKKRKMLEKEQVDTPAKKRKKLENGHVDTPAKKRKNNGHVDTSANKIKTKENT